MDKKIRNSQNINFVLLSSFALAPLLGSTILIFILFLVLYTVKNLTFNKQWFTAYLPIRIIGLAFISYFCCFTILELIHSENLQTATRALGKIFPIFVIGLLGLLLEIKKFPIRYLDIGNAAILGIYLTTSLALFFKFLFPVISINGYDFVTNDLDIHGRLTMFSGNALPFGTMFITVSFLTLAGIAEKSPLNRLIAVSALIVGILTVVSWNQSRGPMLSAIPLLFITFCFIIMQFKLHKKIFSYLVLTLLIIILSVVFYSFRNSIIHFLYFSPIIESVDPTTLFDKYWYAYRTVLEGKPYDLSVYTRLVMYSASIETFFASPFIGHGLDGMSLAILPFLHSEWAEITYRHFHNVFINHSLAGGLIGLVALAMLLASPLITLYHSTNGKYMDTIYCSFIIMTSMIFNGMTNVLFFQDLLGSFFTILILINGIASYHKKTLEF